MEDLIAFWGRCRLDGPTFCHPDDQKVVNEYPELFDVGAMNFDDMIENRRSKGFKHKLHLSLYPVPFAGDLRRADRFINFLN